VEVSEAERAQLERWLRSQTIAHGLAVRGQIVLGSAAGESIRGLAERLQVTQRTVCLWRRRYANQGLDGLRNRPRAGRPRRITAAKEQAVVSATLGKPPSATPWSARRLAQEVGWSKTAVHRIWQKYGLQPHRVETCKFSRDPKFDRKLADLVGLYLDPPERAVVLCVDEKSQIQALNRTQRALPMWPGLPARRPMTTPATARPACSPRWRWPAARFTDAVSSGIPTSSSCFSGVPGAPLSQAGVASDLR